MKKSIIKISKAHPRPWRIEKSPPGWGSQTVIFDANGNHVIHSRVDDDLFEFIVSKVNNEPTPPEEKDCPYCGYFKPCEIHRPELI